MTTIKSKIAVLTILAAVFLSVFAIAVVVDAADRTTADRDRGDSSREITPTPPPSEEPVIEPTPTPSDSSSGGITNVTTGEVESGGNTGGNVTTGDENVEIIIVNTGPVNTSNGVEITSGGQTNPSPTETPCSSDRRDPNACADDGATRGR